MSASRMTGIALAAALVLSTAMAKAESAALNDLPTAPKSFAQTPGGPKPATAKLFEACLKGTHLPSAPGGNETITIGGARTEKFGSAPAPRLATPVSGLKTK